MSNNKNKDKGTRWEREAAKVLNERFPDTWKRIALSGALGTGLGLPMLKGDVKGKYPFLFKGFMAEAKVGYGGAQMSVRKEWFDKIGEAAHETYSYPVVLLKFEGARSGVKRVIAMDFETWDSLMEEIQKMHEEIELLSEQLYDNKDA